MSFLISKSIDLVFYGWTIPRAYAFYLSTEKCRPMEVSSDNFMSFFISICEPALHLVLLKIIIHERERYDFFIAFLRYHLIVIKSLRESSCRSSSFEPSHRKTMFSQLRSKIHRWSKSVRTAVKCAVPDKNLSCQESTCSKYDSLGFVHSSRLKQNSVSLSIIYQNIDNFPLFEIQVRFFFKSFLHFYMILIFICLSSQRMYGRSFSSIEHSALDKCLVYIKTHLTAKSIYFTNKMTLTCSSDRRIACHHSYCFQIYTEKQCLLAHSCCSKSGLTSCVTCTYYYYVICSH